MTFPNILSIIFSIACAIYIFIGIYAIYLDPRNKTNILFFALAASLTIWSFGFSMSIAGETLSIVLFWRRFSAIGFGAFFSVMLHFFLVFTNHRIDKCRRIFYVLLYLPTLIVYLGFTYFPKLNPWQYNLVKSPLGWVNIAVNNIWDVFYIAYYVTYFLTSIILLWRWGKKSKSPKEKRTSRIIIISFFTTTLLSSITDLFGSRIFSADIPQLAPILTVAPAISIYYAIRRYGLLKPKALNESAILMSDQIREKLSNYISLSMIFAAMISFTAHYFYTDDIKLITILLYSGLFIFVSVIMQIVQRIIKRKNLKDILVASIFAMMIPVLSFRYYDDAGTTIWAFPIVIVIVSIMYDQILVQTILYVTIILVQVAMWILMPKATVEINNSHHLIRLATFLSAIWLAKIASRIFHNKLLENTEQIGFQKITTEISTEFISVSEQNLSKKIDIAFSKLGNFLLPDRIYIYMFETNGNSDRDMLKCYGSWTNAKSPECQDMDKSISVTDYPEFIKRIQVGNIIILSNLEDSLSLTVDDLVRFLGDSNKAFVAMPIIIKNKVYGFFGVDSKAMDKPWSETQLDFIRIISLIFSAAFERIQQEQEITQLAYYDYLTKLPNRFLFRDRVNQTISLSERTNKTLAIIFLDLDAFKSINDSIGHDGGDTLIKTLADELKNSLRKTDTVARFGGDEFLILLTNLSSTDAISSITEKILNVFCKPFIINEQEFFITASAGISVYPYDGKDADSLIKNADLAMYKSKELGKNRYMFCTEDMKEEVLYKMKLTNNLFRALDKNEFILHYQPQVCTKSEKIIGAETLIRWIHPEYGLVSPGIFIPLAEQTGLISSIGDWVLKEACRQCKEWHLKGFSDMRIAVNVSFLQLKNPTFESRIKQILKETKLSAEYLELELTESTAVGNSEYIMDVLHSLKKIGITISIDDFGTEYSSLSRLSSMPIDRIKLDMQFIHSIDKSEKENAIIRSIIELSHILGLQVVAEGVETKSQLAFLKEHNNDIVQGYCFYHPLPPADLEEILFNK